MMKQLKQLMRSKPSYIRQKRRDNQVQNRWVLLLENKIFRTSWSLIKITSRNENTSTAVKPSSWGGISRPNFDEYSSMSSHVSLLTKSAFFALYRIGKIRRFLDSTCTEKLIHAFVTSRLDYCNSLFHEIDEQYLARLQRVQNAAARMITRTKKHDHITPVLIKLHWLPVKVRIEFKLLTITYKCLHDLAPEYLRTLIVREEVSAMETVACRTRQSMRHASEMRLVPTTYNQKTFGKRSFSFCAPELWNALPNNIRTAPSLSSFKSMLKTFLFRKHFNEHLWFLVFIIPLLRLLSTFTNYSFKLFTPLSFLKSLILPWGHINYYIVFHYCYCILLYSALRLISYGRRSININYYYYY